MVVEGISPPPPLNIKVRSDEVKGVNRRSHRVCVIKETKEEKKRKSRTCGSGAPLSQYTRPSTWTAWYARLEKESSFLGEKEEPETRRTWALQLRLGKYVRWRTARRSVRRLMLSVKCLMLGIETDEFVRMCCDMKNLSMRSSRNNCQIIMYLSSKLSFFSFLRKL